VHIGSTFIWSYPLIPIGALFSCVSFFFLFFSSDQSLVPLTPPRTLNVEIWELVKMEIYGGCLHIVFIKLHIKGLPPKHGPKKSNFERLDMESWNLQCKKLYVSQLFWPNLGVFRGKKEPKWLPKYETFELLNIERWNSQYRKLFVRQ